MFTLPFPTSYPMYASMFKNLKNVLVFFADKMDLSDLMMSRIDLMLSSVGPGMKVLLMDSDTTSSVSVSCSQSQIMKKEVFLFEYLHAPSSMSKKKNSLAFLKCVVLVRPDPTNIR